ncbi:BamA/TamA family outer membrane protein [bacterium]|nr:BamA/TamA family outer membrane protein [bacterium]
MKTKVLAIAICAIFMSSCSSYKSYYHKSENEWSGNAPTGNLSHSVFLLGDAGSPEKSRQEPTFKLLESQLQGTGKKGTLALLGDNIYPIGLVDSTHPGRAEAERRMKEQLKLVKGFKGKSLIIPGNHDWAQGAKNGLNNLKNQQEFIAEYLKDEEVFYPQDGCPGPIEINVNDELTILLIDTQWWLHQQEKPEGETSSCESQTDSDFLLGVHDILKKNKDKKLLVLGHHPMFAHGTHGGRFTVKDHIFPLTHISSSLYIPLPVLGTLMPLYRSVLGDIQDIQHPRYQELKKGLLDIFAEHPDLVYACGHEHGLEYSAKDGIHYIISGSGSKTTPNGRSKVSKYLDPQKGFAKLMVYDNGDVWVEYWLPEGDGSKGKVSFRKKLYNKPPPVIVSEEDLFEKYAYLDYTDSTGKVPASLQYKAGGVKTSILGSNYRDIWEVPVTVEVFDIGREKGGLRIVQRGGGQQTKSLRLEAEDGRQYVLRSIEKFADGAVPSIIRGTFAADLVQDQISSSHPYGAFVVPKMAAAAGVYHTNPRIVLIPDDPRLGKYREDFANMLALHEERPAGNRSTEGNFGYSKKIVNTAKVLDQIKDDNDNQIDQQSVLRARIFDTFLGDWDRHDDQWRWASFKTEKGKVFRPIPRDRDQAFFRGVGPVMWLVRRKWAIPKFQQFGEKFDNTPGLGFNARYFDRCFLTNKSWEDWSLAVDSLQQNLTDEVIDEAMKDWPKEVYDLSGQLTASRLKARRDSLKPFAKDLYLFLSKTVSVVGSDKKEFFEITRINEKELSVDVYKYSKKGKTKQATFHRVFNADETQEIRLYGQGSSDVFQFMGDAPCPIKIRIIGGQGQDEVTDALIPQGGKKTLIYDKKDGISMSESPNFVSKTSNRPEVNEYDRKSFKYDILMPTLFIGYNLDDGVFLGGGMDYTKHGFRKDPFAQKHFVAANYALNSGSYNFRYNGIFNQVIGKWGIDLDINANVPRFNNTFFGLGNETSISNVLNEREELEFYWTNASQVTGELGLIRSWGNYNSLSITPFVQYIEFNEDRNTDRFISMPELNQLDSTLAPGTNANLFETRLYAGGTANLHIDGSDNRLYPTRGYRLNANASQFVGLNDVSTDYTQVKGDFSLYFTLNPIRTTFAGRVGGATNLGDWDFFQANSVGQLTGLRGYRNNRFAGKSSAFWNAEMRTRFGSIKSFVLPSDIGMLLFYDSGRVWQENEDSNKWHNGYGAGVWIAPYKTVFFSVSYTASEENNPFDGGKGLLLIRTSMNF